MHLTDHLVTDKQLTRPKLALDKLYLGICLKKVQEGNDQENAQSERNSHSKYRGGRN